jgi:hypothetical protein
MDSRLIGGKGLLVTPVRTHAWCMGQTDLPLFPTIPLSPSMPWTLWSLKTSSFLFISVCFALVLDHLQVQIDTRCQSSFQNTPSHTDFKRIDWAMFKA